MTVEEKQIELLTRIASYVQVIGIINILFLILLVVILVWSFND